MSCWITVIYRIIAAVYIQVKSVYAFGVKVVRAIGRNESAPFGIVVACVQEIKPCLAVEVIAAVAYWVVSCKSAKLLFRLGRRGRSIHVMNLLHFAFQCTFRK